MKQLYETVVCLLVYLHQTSHLHPQRISRILQHSC